MKLFDTIVLSSDIIVIALVVLVIGYAMYYMHIDVVKKERLRWNNGICSNTEKPWVLMSTEFDYRHYRSYYWDFYCTTNVDKIQTEKNKELENDNYSN